MRHLIFLLFLSPGAFYSQIQLEEIMQGDDFIGHLPENHRWTENGYSIRFEWNPQTEEENSEYIYTIGKNSTQRDSNSIVPDFHKEQYHYSTVFFTENGDLFAFDKLKNKRTTILDTDNYVRNVQRVTNPMHIYFQMNKNLYLYNRVSGGIQQLTFFTSGEKPEESTPNFLQQQQEELFQYIQEEKTARKKEKQRAHSSKKHHFGKGKLRNIQISPDEEFVSAQVYLPKKQPTTEVESFVTEDGFSTTQKARPKVNKEEANTKLLLLNLGTDSIYFVDFSGLPNIRKKPKYLNDYSDYEEDKEIYIHSLRYKQNSNCNVVDIKSFDNKDRWICSIDLNSGEVTVLDHQHDDAWIGGPGISSWNMVEGTIGWLKEQDAVYFQSEESGYSHLYLYSFENKKRIPLTNGKWEVHRAILSNLEDKFYLTTNKIHSGNREFYHLDVATKKLTPILTQEGAHEVQVSPDEQLLAIRYSYKNKPWELYLAKNEADAKMVQITHSLTHKFEEQSWIAPKVIQFTASDKKKVNARIYEPKTSNGAAVIFVHGAGYLQNAHNYWSAYYREYMFHNLLTEKGYTVLDIDYRASKGYGRDWRTAIYRYMGGKDLQDQIDGKQFLVENYNIDAERVGIYGGSYGGFITLMALLTEPGEFAAGAALRSVTDWAHYNHEYTSNILNYPSTDSLAYRRSSPIYFAENLEDPLLMLHGMVDDNVQFQDVVRLSQRFIESQKEDWDIAIYPVEAHGFRKHYSWTDEYRRILEHFEKYLAP